MPGQWNGMTCQNQPNYEDDVFGHVHCLIVHAWPVHWNDMSKPAK